MSDPIGRVQAAIRAALPRFVKTSPAGLPKTALPAFRVDVAALVEVVAEIVHTELVTALDEVEHWQRVAATEATEIAELIEQRRLLWELLKRQTGRLRLARAIGHGRAQELLAAEGHITRLETELDAAHADLDHWRQLAGEDGQR